MVAILKTDLEQFQKVRGSKYERILHDLTNAQLEMSLPDGVNCKNLWEYLRTEADILADIDSAYALAVTLARNVSWLNTDKLREVLVTLLKKYAEEEQTSRL